MKKETFYLGLAVIIILSAAALSVVRLFSEDGEWVCQNGQWVSQGYVSSPMPTSSCLVAKEEGDESQNIDNKDNEEVKDNEIMIESPAMDEAISSPVKIIGKAIGTWYFEASFPIDIISEDGTVLTTGIAQAQDDWMTEDYVPFESEISFDPNGVKSGYIVFRRDNPSGDPSLDRAYRLPVSFTGEQSDKMIVKVFFGSEQLNPGAADCSLVFPVEREVAKTAAVARAALSELLKGPTTEEIDSKYYTSINPGVGIDSLVIASGTAKVDFSNELDDGIGGSCRVTAIRAQITQTLEQFSTVKDVVISVDGRTEDALQP